MARPRNLSQQRSGDPAATADYDRLEPLWIAAATALVVGRPLLPSEAAASGDGLTFVVLWLVLAAAWVVRAAFRVGLRFRWQWADVPVLAFFAWSIISGWRGISLGMPRPATNMIWESVAAACGYMLLRQLVRSPRDGRALVAVMVALATALSVYAIYQYKIDLPRTRAMYAREGEQLLKDAGVWAPPGSAQRELLEQRLASTEPMASFALTNSLAGFLTPWLVLSASMLLGTVTRKLRGASSLGGERFAAVVGTLVVVLCLLSVCLVLTKSRSAVLATTAGLATVVLLSSLATRRARLMFAGLVVAGVAIAVIAGVARGVLDRELFTEASKSLGYRWQYWQASGHMISDHPLLGVGPGNFQSFYTVYKLPTASEVVSDPHNALVEAGATAGLPAIAALLAAAVMVVLAGFRAKPAQDPLVPAGVSAPMPFRRLMLALAAGGVLAIVVAAAAGQSASVPLQTMLVVFGLPTGAVVVAGLAPWIASGTLTAQETVIAVVALGINLLAAGGLSMPGVSGSLWLLVAMTLSLSGLDKERPLGRGACAAVGAGLVAVLLACYATAYQPVTAANDLMRQADTASNPERLLRTAAEADPSSAEPWQALAELELKRFEDSGDANRLVPLSQDIDAMLERAGPTSHYWRQAGEWQLRVVQRTHDAAWARASVESFRRAAELYPNSGTTQAWLASALAASGNDDAARHVASRAWQLDHLTPHKDQKIPHDLRVALAKIDPEPKQ